MKFILSLVLLLTLFGLPISIEADDSANDVASEDLIFRRSTLIVRDIEKSLDLYRDSIGMELIYDQIIERNDNQIRLIFLKTKDDYVGVLGLVDYEYNNPKVNVSKFYDPDGNLVELNQILNSIH